jgi:hypothetical protein
MFIAENSSSEIFKNIVTKSKDYGYRVLNFPMKKLNLIIKNFWRKKFTPFLFLLKIIKKKI